MPEHIDFNTIIHNHDAILDEMCRILYDEFVMLIECNNLTYYDLYELWKNKNDDRDLRSIIYGALMENLLPSIKSL